MRTYKKMFLVHPDYLNSKDTSLAPGKRDRSDEKKFFSSMWNKQRLSRSTPVLTALGRIQKKIYKILHHPTLKASNKLRKYNALMTRSSILLKKAKNIAGLAATAFAPPGTTDPPSRVSPPPAAASDSNTDEEGDMDDTTLPTPVPSDEEDEIDEGGTESEDMEDEEVEGDIPLPSRDMTSTPRASRAETRLIEDAIERKVPVTYQRNARNLYRLIETEGKGAINWNREGEVVIEGKRVPGSDIVSILTHASRSRPTKSVPEGYEAFTDTLLKFNPSMKYVSGKSAGGRSTPPQTGQGGTVLRWARHL